MAQSLMIHLLVHLAPRLALLPQPAQCGKAPPETETGYQQATNGASCQPCTSNILLERVDKWTHFVHNIRRTSPAVKELLLSAHERPGGQPCTVVLHGTTQRG